MKHIKKMYFLLMGIASAMMFQSFHVEAGEQHQNPVSEEAVGEAMSLSLASDMEVGAKEQIIIEADDLLPVYSEYGSLYNIGDKLNLEGAEELEIPRTRSVLLHNRVQGYLEETGSIALLQFTLDPGLYLQAQLEQPADENIDYNLYVLDADANILTFCATKTYVNGAAGTLPEAVGYVTQGTEAAVYYLAVMSSKGGSATQPFTLDFAVSDEHDSWEPSENPYATINFSYEDVGVSVNGFTVGSPVDNDWYNFIVPEKRKYDKIKIGISTDSVNKCRYEVYRSLSSTEPVMELIASGSDMQLVDVSAAGTYYVRVCNDNPQGAFDDTDIQPYQLTVIPQIKIDTIVVWQRHGNEGNNTYRPYPEGYLFRTTDFIHIAGYVQGHYKGTNETYTAENVHVTLQYYNPYWEQNYNFQLAYRSAEGYTGSDGWFKIGMQLPMAFGGETVRLALTEQHYDVNMFRILVEGSDCTYVEEFVQLDYSDYVGE